MSNQLNAIRYLANMGIISIALFVLSGCAPKPSYAEQLNQRPMPITEQEKQLECSFVRQKIAAEQNNIYLLSTQRCMPNQLCMIPFAIAESNKHIALLEDRASQIECNAAFSSVKVVSVGGKSIKECVETCKANTSRSSTECFDVCNK